MINDVMGILKDLKSNYDHRQEVSEKLSLAYSMLEANDKKLFFRLNDNVTLNINDKFSFSLVDDIFSAVVFDGYKHELGESRTTDFINWFNSWGIA